MKRDNNMKYFNRRKRVLPTLAGMHPEGGFVAWPDGSTSRIKYGKSTAVRRCVDRKGFVAWPVKES